MDFYLAPPVSTTKDWFEFLLDLNLLDKHLKNENPDPNACSLIIHFLYHANLTEQLFSSNAGITSTSGTSSTNAAATSTTANTSTTTTVKPQPASDQQPIEIKTKRIKVLRILAIKAAAFLNWNLQTLEKDVPVAVMSDLLHILLQLALQNSENKPHNQLDLKAIDSHALFALQLLHRWCIRTSIYSKYPVKPSKTIQVSVPGIINPLQHMKEANENILKTLSQTSVLESIEFLEKFLLILNDDLIQPTSSCFTNINSETGEYDLIWSNGIKYSLDEYQLLIRYDLAQYYFHVENYQKCFNLLNTNLELFHTITSNLNDQNNFLRSYCNNYEALFLTSKSIAGIENNENLSLIDEHKSVKSVNLLFNKVENSIQNNFQGIFDLLIEDNKKSELTVSYRLNLEKLAVSLNNNEILDQICSCNLVRFIHDDYYCYKNYDLNKLNYLSKVIIQSHTTKHVAKSNINVFIELNFKNFNKKCQQELENSVHYNFVKLFNPGSEPQQQLMDYQEASPSSPVESHNPSFSSNASVYEYVQLAIKSIDHVLIKHAISNYNQQTQNKGMKNYWPNEWSLSAILDYLQPQQQATFLSNLNKLNSVNDTDFIHISFAKIKRLKKTKKYDLALKLLKNLEDSVKNNEYLTKFIVNETLIINIKKILNDNNAEQIKSTKYYEQLVNNCKTFINNSSKSDTDISADAIQTAFGFILNSNEYRFVLNQNPSKVIPSYFGYLELSKKLVKFCMEAQSEKGTSRKSARELWDCIIEIFSDSLQTKRPLGGDQSSSSAASAQQQDQQGSTTIARESQTSCLTREAFRKYVKLIRNTQILSILFSLISTLYNIRDSSCNVEITSEYRNLWPSSLTHMNAVNLNYINDILNLLIKQCLIIDPLNITWLRTIGDIYFSQALFSESLKFYLKQILCETKYFFQQNQIQKILNEKLLKNMIRSCIQMNKFTHAICLCQYLPVIDYTTAFKCFQEESCCDNMDELYLCIWDVTLLEYLIHINSKRAYFDKRNLGMAICSLPETNESNPKEIRDKNIELKRILLFIKFIKYYFL